MAWARWIDETFPEDPHVNYNHHLGDSGAKKVRVWQLSFRDDYGVSGYIDPEQCECLLELVLSSG